MIREVKSLKEFLPFPSYKDRQGWDALPDEMKTFYTAMAKERKGQEWPSLTASLYLEFYRNGNRSHFQAKYYKRRRDLFLLLLAECIEAKGEYLDEIIDAVWLICEESTWVIPAHLNYKTRMIQEDPPKELPDITGSVYIDLFAAETGSVISWVYYFLAEVIAARAPQVKRRMELEMERRLLTPYLEHNDYQWMGLDYPDPVNNWNPWINSNMLISYLVFASTFAAYTKGVAKTIRSINRFLYFYAEDGGCDEGPSYFNCAGASLVDYIEELGQITDVSYLYQEEKIRNMVSYIYKVYIAKNYYVNYADAAPAVSTEVDLLNRAGKNTGNNTLCNFAAYIRSNRFYTPDILRNSSFNLYRQLANLFTAKPDADAGKAALFKAPETSYFEGIQVLTARDSEDITKGFFFSAKGGHNGESHNHNDVGNFLLYYRGKPVLVDAGVEEYTKFTFNEKRYTLWAMRSYYHNTPGINGREQSPGTEHGADDVVYSHSENLTCFSLDITRAYPAEAALQSYKREFIFKRGEGLTVTDSYSLHEWKAPLVLNFLCYDRPEIQDGKVILGGKVTMGFTPVLFETSVEEIALTDTKMRNDWQKENLFRLCLSKKDRELAGKIELRFRYI
ncbi:MAG: heparinase II/III-family protein [Treponema sp.]|jgi:hypothetical protein|nr:heparinase II/III-family protein [Treponema sp.]